MSQFRKVHRVLAFLSFLISFATYYATCYPSISFGESGGLAAAAFHQQVPGAPGAPLWIIVAGTFAKLFPGDPAYILTLFSALCGAVTAMLVYLVTVSLGSSFAREVWEEDFSDEDSPARKTGGSTGIAILVGGMIAALSFTWFDSQWANATQITTRSAGTLVVALVLWLSIRWYYSDREGEPGSLRWLLLAAYATGLGLGVNHLLLDLIPGIIMIVWMRRVLPEGEEGRYTLGGLLAMVGLLLLRYALGVHASYAFIPILILAVVGAGLAAAVPKVRSAGIACAFLLIFVLLGYSLYTHVVLRSDAHPAMNMIATGADGEPKIFSYIHTSPVEADRKAPSSFSSRGQVGHDYMRPLLWNTVGRAGNIQDAPAAWFGVADETRREFIAPAGGDDSFPIYFFALPLLLALIGLTLNFWTDWRSGIVLLTLFLSLGPLSAVVWSFGPGTTGEGDGFIASSLLVVAIWIGLGASGLAQAVREWRLKQGRDEASVAQGENLANGMLVLCLFLGPINLLYNGWSAHDQGKNRLPHDFAFNLLQSCDSNAILFTEDARPLQYLQDVEGLRRDVRVVDLSLAGKEWYRTQLQTERVWNAEAVPANISEGAVFTELKERQIRKSPPFTAYTSDSVETVRLPVSGREGTADTLIWNWQGLPDTSGRIRYTLPLRLIRQIVETNNWKRPVFFAMNVHPTLWGGLERFFRWEGLAFRLLPERELKGIEGYTEFPIDNTRMTTLLAERFLFNNLDPDGTAFTHAERKIIPLYRRAFIALAADALKNRNAGKECADALQAMDRVLPPEIFPLPYWEAAAVASLCDEAGDNKTAEKYARHTIEGIERTGDGWQKNPVARRYNPYQTTARMYALLGEYDKAIAAYQSAKRDWSSDPLLRGLVEELRIERHFAKKDTGAGVAELQTIIREYGTPTDPQMRNNLEAWKEMLEEIQKAKGNIQKEEE